MIINYPISEPFEKVKSFGIAVSQYPGRQNHIGILYKSSGDMNILHVSGHKEPLVIDPESYYLWLDEDCLDPIDKSLLLASIINIADVNKDTDIRYGLNHNLYCIDLQTGIFNKGYDITAGFTCATFVLEVFLTIGTQLIDWKTWPSDTNEAKTFHHTVLNYLYGRSISKQDVTPEYLSAQVKLFGSPRFSPQEIAAATQNDLPITYKDVYQDAKTIHNALSNNYDFLHQVI
jgi:hypothetical protein